MRFSRWSSSSPVIAHAEIVNAAAPGGPVGQQIQAIPVDRALPAGGGGLFFDQVASVFVVREDSGWRTNLGLVNLSDRPITLTLLAFSGGFSVGGSLEVDLRPCSHAQVNRVWTALTAPGDPREGVVRVECGDCEPHSFVAYASRVDNASGDASYPFGWGVHAAGDSRDR